MTSIYDLSKDAIAVVEHVSDFKLAEIGLFKGVEVRVLQPGNPCIIQCRGSKLCIGHVDVLVRQ